MKHRLFFTRYHNLLERTRAWLLTKLAGDWAVVINVDILPKPGLDAVLKATNGEYVLVRQVAFGENIMIRHNHGRSGSSKEFTEMPKDPRRYKSYTVRGAHAVSEPYQ